MRPNESPKIDRGWICNVIDPTWIHRDYLEATNAAEASRDIVMESM